MRAIGCAERALAHMRVGCRCVLFGCKGGGNSNWDGKGKVREKRVVERWMLRTRK